MAITTEPDIHKIHDIIKEILLHVNEIGPGVDFVRIVSLLNNKRH
jgi:hypothetical protein